MTATKVLTPDELYAHSLRVMMEHQDRTGAFLAGPHMPDYQYSWFRDGAYIAHALMLAATATGQLAGKSPAWDAATNFHTWCAETILSREDAIERAIAAVRNGGLSDPRDLLNTRYRPDGSAGTDEWPEFQLDGPGTWLWSLADYVTRARISPLPFAWAHAIELTAAYLAALWQLPCYDCWEELGDDVHISTLGAIYGGLQAAQALVPGLDYRATCAAIRQFVLDKGLTPGGELAKSLGRDMVDANLLTVALPHGLLRVDDPIMRRTADRIARELRSPGSGVHRHVEDVYYGGSAWVLLALWLAWYDLETGNNTRARELITWAEAQADEGGDLPEQVPAPMLFPEHYAPWVERRGEIARPLLWSHAMYVTLRNLHPEMWG